MLHAFAEADLLAQIDAASDITSRQCRPPAAIVQRNLNVFQNCVLRDQIERLKDKANQMIANVRQIVVAQFRNAVSAEDILATGGPVERTEQVEQRALAAARRAHNGDEIPLRKLHTHAMKGFDDDTSLEVVVFVEVDDFTGKSHSRFSLPKNSALWTLNFCSLVAGPFSSQKS